MAVYTGWELFKNHFKATVGSSRFGLLWEILPSLFWCVVFIYIQEGGSAAIRLAIGMVIYQMITDSFRSGSGFFHKNLPLFIQKPGMIHATIIHVTIHSIISGLFKVPIIYAMLLLFTDIPFHIVWLYFFLVFPLMIILSLSLGLVFSFASYLNRDLTQISYIIPLLILVFTPIIFIPENGFVSVIQGINPFSHWLYLLKGLLLNSALQVERCIFLTLGSTVIFGFTWKFICYTMPYVAEEAR